MTESLTAPLYRSLLRGGSSVTANDLEPHTGPASICSTACCAVTPQTGSALMIAQSSEDGPRSPGGPGWITIVGRTRQTSSGTRSRRNGQITRSGSVAATADLMLSAASASWTVTW